MAVTSDTGDFYEPVSVDLAIVGATVVTMNRAREILKDATVIINAGRIVTIDNTSQAQDSHYRPKRTLNANGCVVTPGLIDAHNHPIHYLSKGLADDLNHGARSHHHIWPFESQITEAEGYISALGSFLEMISNGTTCFSDPGSYCVDSVARAALDIGIRGIVAQETWDIPSQDGSSTVHAALNHSVDSAEQKVLKWNGAGAGRLRAWFSLVRPSDVSNGICVDVKQRADRYGVGIHGHMVVPSTSHLGNQSSGPSVNNIIGSGSAIRRYSDLGLLGPNLQLVHLGGIPRGERVLLKHHDVKVVHCPSASMLGGFGAVAHGTFPEMIDEGITVGLGTDAGAVSRFLDLVRVSYLSACAHKDARVDAEVMGAEAAFEMATTAGATAALWDDEIGSIEVGKKADIVVFSTDAPEWHPNPLHNPVANLVYSASGKSARDVIIDGRLVMENRQFNELDVNDYYRRACKTASGIYDRLGVSVGPKSWPIR